MKKIISIVLASAMLTASASALAVEYGEEYTNMPTKTYTQKFDDVSSSHWAFAYIGEMSDREVVSGYPNGKFYPNNEVTRAEFARIMTSASGLQISAPTSKDFNDVALDAWYAPYVHAAYPYLSGYNRNGGSYYMPDTPALREDIAVALVKLKGYDTLGADESLLKTMFTDVDSISSDARKYVAVAVERGLVSGYEDDTFRGQNSITRAEATAMLWRAYQYGNDNKSFDVEVSTPEPATPIPSATVEPADTSTPEPTATSEPTAISSPEPTENNTKYIIDSVAKIKMSTFYSAGLSMATDGSRIWYIDNTDDDIIHKIYNGKESEYFNPDGVVVDGMKNFSSSQLGYDNVNDRLLLRGYFFAKENPDGVKDYEIKEQVILDITDTDNIFIAKDKDIYSYFLPNGYAISSGNVYDSDGALVMRGTGGKWYLNRGTDIRTITEQGVYDIGGETIRDFKDELDNGKAYMVGKKDDKFIVWTYDNRLVSIDFDGKMTVIEEDFSPDNMKAVDYKSTEIEKDYGDMMYVTDYGIYVVDIGSKYIRVIREVE